jgi:hypothetical protein
MANTTYTTIGSNRVGLTPTEDGTLVSVTTRSHNLGFYRIDRFGPNPLTPKGRLTADAVRAFHAHLSTI